MILETQPFLSRQDGQDSQDDLRVVILFIL